MSKLVRYITEDGSAFIIAADSTEMIRKMEQIHQPSAAVTAGGYGQIAHGSLYNGSYAQR